MIHPSSASQLRILVTRRDNIGDLVCTTPLIHSLRQHLPDARIDALVNSYNVAVIANNPDLDQVYAYTKGKHRDNGQSSSGIYWQRVRMYWQLYRQRYDYIILGDSTFSGRALQMARWFRPRHIIGFAPDSGSVPGLDLPIANRAHTGHVTEQLAQLLQPFAINGAPPALRLQADPAQASCAATALQRLPGYRAGQPLIGLHISARKPSQRWPAERFVELARRLHAEFDAAFLLFWSPGAEDNPQHPGDDNKARRIIDGTTGLPLLPFPTAELPQLIAGLSLVDRLICSDGGAMHIGAGLGKPIVCFFGQSGLTQWHPWGVPFVALQPESRQVADVSVEQALTAYRQLLAQGTQVGSTAGNASAATPL